MANPTVVAVGESFRLFGESVTTHKDLPPDTYTVEFNEMTGYSLERTEPLAPGDEAVYGSHAPRVERIAKSFQAMDRSLGVILSGDKGMGKSLMIRMIAEEMRDRFSVPTIIVHQNSPGIAAFLDKIGEAVIVFDEFEKIFNMDDGDGLQTQFLSLFDGMSTTKRLYVLSVNVLHKLSDYMQNRPGRFHYHMRFTYPGPDMIRTYLKDQAPGATEDDISEIISFSQRFDLSFDHLRAISFELNLGESFINVVGDLNIKRSRTANDRVSVRVVTKNGATHTFSGNIDLFDDSAENRFYDYESQHFLKFKMLGATDNADGFDLDLRMVDLVDRNAEDDDDDSIEALLGTDKKPGSTPLESATLTRVRASIDFSAATYPEAY